MRKLNRFHGAKKGLLLRAWMRNHVDHSELFKTYLTFDCSLLTDISEKQQCWSTFLHLYILSCYSVNLLIYWICYHSNCFHSSRSKKWSNILHNGLSFVEEISRWLKLHGVKNDVKLLRIEINLLRWTIFSRIHRNVCICCENEILFSFLLEWFKDYCRRKENKIKRFLAVCCKFNARIV